MLTLAKKYKILAGPANVALSTINTSDTNLLSYKMEKFDFHKTRVQT